MSCESGKIPYNGLCYTPSELVKVMTTKSANTATQPKTETETKKGFDWMAALAILAGAAPAVIAATKGEKPNPYANAGTENRSDNTPPPVPDESIPMWVWIVGGVVIGVVIYFVFQAKK